MSIESLTGDDFMRLDPEEHREALSQYDTLIGNVASNLSAFEPGSTVHTESLDKLCRLASLRKVHRVRLAEMEEVEAVPAGARYPYAEAVH